MCRHFAYLGDQVSIRSVLFDPPHSLVEQAWAPRWQKHGTMNVDGFGVGWYSDDDPLPARYRRTGPIWSDDCLPDLARVTRTHAMLCAVRSASVGTDTGAAAAAPYTDGRWLFSLNGALVGWSAAAGGSTTPRRRMTASARAEAAGESITEPAPAVTAPASLAEASAAVLRLAERLPAADLLQLQARCDTALLWGMVLPRLRAGEPPADALAATVTDIWAAGGTGRFNLLLTDGEVIAATAAGDSLCYRHRPDGVIVASEPSDTDPAWHKVPDCSVVEATTAAVTVRPIAAATSQAGQLRPAEAAGHPNGKAARP
ncbi:MAG TPA: class II glutamine amidotransferase [Streptosporangiaceae bacterium]|nr:class II glutamine amidotransferase [Streptosporangiaceae bacterium]